MRSNCFLSLTAVASLFTSLTATAQSPEYLLTYSQAEATISGSGGTVLASLRPNEICQLRPSSVTCPSLSAEKWMPRAATNVMAGDEDADGQYDHAALFGRIDALLANQPSVSGIAGDNQRTVFWSPSQAMGNAISATPFRPGDVGRIIRNGAGEGQVQYFIEHPMDAGQILTLENAECQTAMGAQDPHHFFDGGSHIMDFDECTDTEDVSEEVVGEGEGS